MRRRGKRGRKKRNVFDLQSVDWTLAICQSWHWFMPVLKLNDLNATFGSFVNIAGYWLSSFPDFCFVKVRAIDWALQLCLVLPYSAAPFILLCVTAGETTAPKVIWPCAMFTCLHLYSQDCGSIQFITLVATAFFIMKLTCPDLTLLASHSKVGVKLLHPYVYFPKRNLQ